MRRVVVGLFALGPVFNWLCSWSGTERGEKEKNREDIPHSLSENDWMRRSDLDADVMVGKTH